MNAVGRLPTAALLLVPGALTVYLSFNAGGFFPNTPAFVAIVVAAILLTRTLLAEAPLAGVSGRLALAAAALAAYAAWTLASALWSDALGRSLIEFDRALLYILVLVLFGSIARSSDNLRWMLRGLALAIVAVCLVALTTRILPEVWPIGSNLGTDRLSYPLTYWNALGLLTALGIVFCVHTTCCPKEPRLGRVAAAAALPALATTLLFTFSRGGIGAAILGVAAYIVLGRPLGLLSGLLAAGPATAVSLIAAYHADLLASDDPTGTAAVAQGHDLALVVAICMVGAAIARLLLLRLDTVLARATLPVRLRPSLLGPAAAVAAAAAVALVLVLDVPTSVAHQYDRFVHGNDVGSPGDLRSRLTDPGNNGRIDQWDVAIKGFEDHPLHGQGAGTYELQWAKYRPNPSTVTDAHSLYAEVLGELGIVGIVLLAVPLLAILGRAASRMRKPNRGVYAAVVAATLAWAFHAGIDWDWETPAVTLWLFAVGGAVLARSVRREPLIGPASLPLRTVVAIGCVALAVVPGLVLASQARLDDSGDWFEAGDCPAAISSARSSSSVLGMRAEPYQIIGYCELRGGSPARAVDAMEKAVDRDPDNWEYHLGLAVARGAGGLDPRPQARTALRLNPRGPSARDAARRFDVASPSQWKRRSRELVRLVFQ